MRNTPRSADTSLTFGVFGLYGEHVVCVVPMTLKLETNQHGDELAPYRSWQTAQRFRSMPLVMVEAIFLMALSIIVVRHCQSMRRPGSTNALLSCSTLGSSTYMALPHWMQEYPSLVLTSVPVEHLGHARNMSDVVIGRPQPTQPVR